MTGPAQPHMTSERWWRLSLCEQLGNVGSEFSRTVKWRTRDPQIAQRALERALELIDLTREDPRRQASASCLRELCRTREVLVDFLAGTNQYGSTAASLQRYFDAFAVAASAGTRRYLPK